MIQDCNNSMWPLDSLQLCRIGTTVCDHWTESAIMQDWDNSMWPLDRFCDYAGYLLQIEAPFGLSFIQRYTAELYDIIET